MADNPSDPDKPPEGPPPPEVIPIDPVPPPHAFGGGIPPTPTTGDESGAESTQGARSGSTVGFEIHSNLTSDHEKVLTAQGPQNSEDAQSPITTATAPGRDGTSGTERDAEDEAEGQGQVEGQQLSPEEEDTELEYLKQLDLTKNMSVEELEAEEAEFRAKYALDLEDEEETEGIEGQNEEEAEEEVTPEPTAQQMNAIIKFLEEEEEEEEEGDGDAQEFGALKNLGNKLKSKLDSQIGTQDIKKSTGRQDGSVSSRQGKSGTLASITESGDVQVEEPNVMILGPDHPKMARFQKALKDHLKRQIYAADLELRNLENDLKMKKKDRTELGTTLYNLQHEILRQSETMEKCEKDMVKIHDKREKTEEKSRELRSDLLELRAECQKEEEKEINLRESIKTLDFTEHVVREAAEKYDGELKVRQLVADKLEKMRVKSEAEKRDQDFYLDKVLTHVQHMELINAGIRRQIQAHQEEQGQLNTYINEAVTEIEALQIEKGHLQRAWNDTISVVRARDDALMAAREALQKTLEELRIRESELRSISRLISKEQEGHERSVILLRRRKMEERVLKNQLLKLSQNNDLLKSQLANLNKLRKAVETELLKANNVFFRKQKEVFNPRRQIELLASEKIRLEDQILLILHEQTGLSKAASHIKQLIKEAREKARSMENEVARVENENSLLAVDVEELRANLFKKTSTLSELEKRSNSQEKVLQEQLKDIQQSERVIQKKAGEVEMLNKKLQKIISQQGGVEMGPIEREIDNLEKQIAQEKEQVTSLQEDWLKRQDSLVRLSAQRDYVIHQNELLRKEVFVLERKRQRLDTEVEKKKGEIVKVKKATEGIRSEISVVNSKLHKDRSNHDQMDKDNVLVQNELVALLKDAEMEAVELENEIKSLEDEKHQLIQQLHEVHEQNLQWEKKVRLAKELKDSIKKENEGSNSALKLDIHHMQVRYNEIIRTQEKLISDLERSIERRDRIISQADMNLHRENANPRHTKMNIQRNFASVKERNRLLVREANEIEQQVRDTMESIRSLENKWNDAANQLNNVRESIQNCEEKIADASILKHKNLVEIVLRQEKFRILESIKYNRYKPSGKSMEEIQKMLDDAEKECFSIVNLADELTKEYPEVGVHVKLVKASILPGVN